MTATNHAITGVVIALVVKNPYIALPLAFVSHFVLDVLPHFGVPGHAGFAKTLKASRVARFIRLEDPTLLLLLTAFLLVNSAPWYVFVAGALAILPDAEWFIAYFIYESKNKKAPRSPIANWHEKIQWCERPWGIWTEAVWLAGMFLILNHLIK